MIFLADFQEIFLEPKYWFAASSILFFFSTMTKFPLEKFYQISMFFKIEFMIMSCEHSYMCWQIANIIKIAGNVQCGDFCVTSPLFVIFI